MVIMSTSALEVSIHAVSPESIFGASAAKRSPPSVATLRRSQTRLPPTSSNSLSLLSLGLDFRALTARRCRFRRCGYATVVSSGVTKIFPSPI